MRAGILGIIVLLVGGAAGADPGGPRGHLLAGLELYSQGKYAAALAEYQAAWVTSEDSELILDMAECNRHLGNLDVAREQYRGFLQRAPRSPLRGSVERQLALLDRPAADAPPPAELVVAAAPPRRAEERRAPHAGRAAKAIGIAGWVLSAAATVIGVVTWQESSQLESRSHADLAQLRPSNPLGSTPEEAAFFRNPSCTPPSTLMGTGAFVRDCTRGQQYSDATTALFVSGAAFAVGGTVAYILGTRQAARAHGVEIRPAVSYNGAALQLRVAF